MTVADSFLTALAYQQERNALADLVLRLEDQADTIGDEALGDEMAALYTMLHEADVATLRRELPAYRLRVAKALDLLPALH